MGVPAKVRGQLSDEDRAYTQTSADDYQREASELAEAGFFYTAKIFRTTCRLFACKNLTNNQNSTTINAGARILQ